MVFWTTSLERFEKIRRSGERDMSCPKRIEMASLIWNIWTFYMAKKLNLDFYVAKETATMEDLHFYIAKKNATWPYKNWEHDEKLLEVGFISELKMMRIT